ncbi:MAG TPA: PspC domain-containing protein [Vicinamibacterales bacterium]|nr:PspC domain-containing protein [Vicinamibacterales bacterium]
MQKVTGINLNGNAYQVEEQGYVALRAYLDDAEAQLKDNPDRAEILADLEQAIGEKCQKVLGPHKTVVTALEISRIVGEMGPVDGDGPAPAGGPASGSATGAKTEQEHKTAPAGAPKRLYQIREGAMLSGVCNGLAAYFDIDVTIVRIVFVVLAVLTKGLWILVYVVMSFVIPYANTSEERAAARGRRFNAQDVVDQAKRNYADFKTNPAWRRHWRMQKRQWRRQWHYTLHDRWWSPEVQGRAADAASVWYGLTSPIYAVVSVALVVLLALALMSLGATHALFGYPLPPGVPLWAAFLVVIAVYSLIASPFHHSHRYGPYGYTPLHAWVHSLVGLLWLVVIAFSIWYGYHYVPAVHDFILRLPDVWNQFVDSLS